MLTHHALTGLREYLMNRIAYAQYMVNGIYHKARIESAAIMNDGRISVSLIIAASISGGALVKEVSLYDAQDICLASKAENIMHTPSMGGIYYRFFFRIEEVE